MQMSGLRRFEGRLFNDAGRICLVVEADEVNDVARVSCQVDGQRQVIEMPLATVSEHLSAGVNLSMDGASEPDLAKRLIHKPDGWFFSTREGLHGPFLSGKEAEDQLSRHLIANQAATGT